MSPAPEACSRRAARPAFGVSSTAARSASMARRRQGTLDESSPPNPDNVYGRTKLAAERVVREKAGEVETCIVRISETYGPGDFRLLKLFRAIDQRQVPDDRQRREPAPGHARGRPRTCPADRRGSAAAGARLSSCPGEEVLTTRQMVDVIAAVLGRSVPRVQAADVALLDGRGRCSRRCSSRSGSTRRCTAGGSISSARHSSFRRTRPRRCSGFRRRSRSGTVRGTRPSGMAARACSDDPPATG